MDKLGIVLATYNEADNLPRLVHRLEELSLPAELRIFVVDDDSPDGTSDVADRLASQYGNIRLITRLGKLGLGSAIRDGMKAALAEGCDRVLTMDADMSHSPQDVPRLLAASQGGGAELVQASRYMKGGGITGLVRWRRLHSRVANLLCRWVLGLPSDSTTNFRVYSGRSVELVLRECRGNGFEFQPESALIAMRHRLSIVEVPIVFNGREHGKSKLGVGQFVRWGRFFMIAAISFRLRLGRYSKVNARRDLDSR